MLSVFHFRPFIFLVFILSYSFLTADIKILHEAPTPEEFVALRSICKMRERSLISAKKGIKNSLFWVTLRLEGQLIGMGRVIGDGGTVAQISDIAVHPDYQKQGYGKLILEHIHEYILNEIPDDAFVCLFAEKDVALFYQKLGYIISSDQWPGMYWPCADRKRIKSEILHFVVP